MVNELIESILEVACGRRGMLRRVNGLAFRVHPRVRARFTVDYDSSVADFLREIIRPGMTCFNVGANVGIFAMQMATWCGPDGRVYAFEPNPQTAALLRKHILMNGIASQIEVVEVATASDCGTMEFFASGTDGMSRLGSPNPLLREISIVTVDVTTLDAFCQRENVRPDVVLMDIEGFEYYALRGFRETILDSPHMEVVLEMHPSSWADAGYSAAEFRHLLDDLELLPVPLTGQSDPIDEYGVVHLKLGPSAKRRL